MNNDVSPLQSLNISIKYVKHWNYLHGFRELYQNAMDAFLEKYPTYKLLHRRQIGTNITSFTQARRVGNNLELIQANYISYNKATKTLIFQNQKSFPIKCLLMGCSQKPPEALGQFGQGLKLAMLVILNAGLDMRVQSGDNIYYPTLKSWDHSPYFTNKYDSQVLYIKIQPNKQKIDKTKVIIDNVDNAKFEQFLYLSLALLDETKYEKIVCGPSTLIIPNDPKLIGKVYKKGVRLQLHQSSNSVKFMHYSYDFDTIQVGRDRDCVNNVWDLYRLQSQLHYNVMSKLLDKKFLSDNPHLKSKLKQHLSNISSYLQYDNMQTYYFREYSCKNKPLSDLLFDKFLERQGSVDEMYPQYDNYKVKILQNLNLYGLPNNFYPKKDVNWQEWHVLIHSNKFVDITNKIQNQIVNKQIRDLTAIQADAVKQIIQIVKPLCPEISQYTFKIKTFKEILCCKDKNVNQKIIYLNPDSLGDKLKMARSIGKMLLQ